MLARTALALLLLLPAAAAAQELDTAVSAVVRISGKRDGTPVRGSGFVVGLDRDKATIVTASHVIEGVQQLEVNFAVDGTEGFPAGSILGMDAGSPNGLAAFQVRGALPAGITILSFLVESRPRLGDELFLVGFPWMEFAPRTPRRVLSGRRGSLMLIDQGIGEGFSGGPVLQDGKVIGVVTNTDDQTTYAVNAVVARESLEGWGIKLSKQGSSPELNTTTTKQAARAPEMCAPGEERAVNGIVFVRICPGTFTMGSAKRDPQANDNEKPAHQVTLSEFWIGKTEITNEQYRLFRPDHQGEAGLPATSVRWTDAQAACEHFGGRLPTEAEWEYAARSGKQTAWSFSNEEGRLGRYAWYAEKADSGPHPVGKKKPNAWGLHDMHGNVWEWIADWYGPYPSTTQTDPTGPIVGKDRVLRGGSYSDSPTYLRSAYRVWLSPGDRFKGLGFRCVLGPGRQP